MNSWQSIETAPTDQSVLLYEPFEPIIVQGYYSDDEWSPSNGGRFFRQPTHWMPLPDPPAE
jgi:hypothetical protein